jgi:hypothetical protein
VDARSLVLGGGGIPRPADVTVAPGTHNLPRPPEKVFVGREEAAAQLDAGLADDGSVVLTQAVVGLGGVGKSELALQYAHAQRQRYSLTWWITAEDPAQVESGLAALAGRLCPEQALAATTTEAAEWAVTWLQAHPGWLLILDDVSEAAQVEPLLGQLHGGHVVLTTRRDTGWERIATQVWLDMLDPVPATAFITAMTRPSNPEETQAAADIAAELGYLPLALDQAIAYIVQARVPTVRYLDLLREHPVRMYAATAAGDSVQRTIARLWDITLEAIGRANPAGVHLLRILACYASDNIPRRILGGEDGGPDVNEALALLASYSMITLTADSVSLHKLVQAVILAAPGDVSDIPPPRAVALKWIHDALPPRPQQAVAAWPFLRVISPHAEAIVAQYLPADEPAAVAYVLNEIGLFYNSQGDYLGALRLQTVSLEITRRH